MTTFTFKDIYGSTWQSVQNIPNALDIVFPNGHKRQISVVGILEKDKAEEIVTAFMPKPQ